MFFVTNCLGVDYTSHRRSAEIQWRSAVAEVSGDQRRTAEVSAGPPEVQRRSAEVSFSEIPEIPLLFRNGTKKVVQVRVLVVCGANAGKKPKKFVQVRVFNVFRHCQPKT